MNDVISSGPRVIAHRSPTNATYRKRPTPVGTINFDESGPVLIADAHDVDAPDHPVGLRQRLRQGFPSIARFVARWGFLKRLHWPVKPKAPTDEDGHGIQTATTPSLDTRERADGFPVYMSFEVFGGMYEHCAAYASEHEVMGLIVGDVFCDEDGEFAEVFSTMTGELDSNRVHVRFTESGLAAVSNRVQDLKDNGKWCPLDGKSKTGPTCSVCGYDARSMKILGWYHSHPGFTAFMSGTDIATHQEYFSQPYHISIVIDPLKKEYRVWQTTEGPMTEIPVNFTRSGVSSYV